MRITSYISTYFYATKTMKNIKKAIKTPKTFMANHRLLLI